MDLKALINPEESSDIERIQNNAVLPPVSDLMKEHLYVPRNLPSPGPSSPSQVIRKPVYTHEYSYLPYPISPSYRTENRMNSRAPYLNFSSGNLGEYRRSETIATSTTSGSNGNSPSGNHSFIRSYTTTSTYTETPSFLDKKVDKIFSLSESSLMNFKSSTFSRSSTSPDDEDFSDNETSGGHSLTADQIKKLFNAANNLKNPLKSKRDIAMLALLLDLKLACQRIADLKFKDLGGILDGTFQGIYRYTKNGKISKSMKCHKITATALKDWISEVCKEYGWNFDDEAPVFVPLAFFGPDRKPVRQALKRDAISKVFTTLKMSSGVLMNKEMINRTNFDEIQGLLHNL